MSCPLAADCDTSRAMRHPQPSGFKLVSAPGLPGLPRISSSFPSPCHRATDSEDPVSIVGQPAVAVHHRAASSWQDWPRTLVQFEWWRGSANGGTMRAHRYGKMPDTMRSVEMRKHRSETLPKICRRAEDALPYSTLE